MSDQNDDWIKTSTKKTSEMIHVSKEDYDEIVRRLHEAEEILLKQNELIESIKRLCPKKIMMEF